MARINPDTVRLVQQAADIIEVIGDFVSLKKRGANYIACCPFHNEKTPSFNVSPSRGIYKCFGCGKAGDAVRFVMDIEGIGFAEAIRFLAQKYGIEVQEAESTPEDVAAQNERESLYIVLNFAKNFYQQQLTQTDEGQSIGLSYFKERGFLDKTIQDFDLGYSPDVWDALTKAAQKQGFSLDILEKAGLTIRKDDGKTFDRFRGRVVFPIHNVAGKVIAFGARTLKADKNQPKYLNSPETEVYHKSSILYGIAQAKNAMRNEDVCYLVEGYTDVVSLHQAGISNVVASSGTSLTLEQIKLIGRFTQHVTMLYDGDAAGIKASLRGTDMILEEGLNVKVVVFPDGEDPDSYVRRVGSEAFRAYIQAKANDFITFKAELSIKEAGSDPFKRAEIIRDMVESISKIPDSIKRTVFFQRTASLMGIDEAVLVAESNKIFQAKAKEETKKRSQAPAPSDLAMLVGETFTEDDPLELPEVAKPRPKVSLEAYQEEECIRLLLCYGQEEIETGIALSDYILHELKNIDFLTPAYREILDFHRASYEKGYIPIAKDYLSTYIDNEEIRLLIINIIANNELHDLSDGWENRHKIFVPTKTTKLPELGYQNILRVKNRHVDKLIEKVQQQIKEAKNIEESEIYLKEYLRLKSIKSAITKELGIVVNG